jgi:hypothetical protein
MEHHATTQVLDEPSVANDHLAPHATLLLGSHLRIVGRPLLRDGPSAAEQARALYEAPFVVLSHGAGPDPLFAYGNLSAQRLFEMSWQELTRMPSRLSAEPVARAERARLLATVAARGYVDDYRGVRIAKSGRRFAIEGAVVWSLVDAAGVLRGQAATFETWTPLE